MDFLSRMCKGDRVIWMIFASLCLISIVEIFSASYSLTYKTNYLEPISRHIMFLASGIVIVWCVHSINPKYFSFLAICLPVACCLLIITRIFGKPVNGSYRWIEIFSIRFQPSEIAKLCLIAATAYILSWRKNDNHFRWICIATGVTCGIIFIDNGSTALMLGVIVVLMMFVGQIRLDKEIGKIIKNLLKGFLFCILHFIPDEKLKQILPQAIKWKKSFQKGFIGFAVLFIVLVGILCALHFIPDAEKEKFLPRKTTWKNRTSQFFSEVDVRAEGFKITNKNYQSAHGCIAISNGGIFGKLPGNGTERETLPQAYSDFIYAIIIEEMGLIGGIVVIFLYVMLFIRSGIIAHRCGNLFPKLLVIGSAMVLVIQALSNMAVAVHLIPVSGQPLPLISRGGTSTWINCVYIGIILSVSRFENPIGVKREKDDEQEMKEEELREMEEMME